MSAWTLSLLGSASLKRDGIVLHLRSRKAIALLAYLAVTGVHHSRAALATLLWPESSAKTARDRLRHALWVLRNALEGAWLVVDRTTVGLNGSQQQHVDVTRFRSLLEECRRHSHPVNDVCAACLPLLSDAVELYQGDFMLGFTLDDSVQFDDWQSLEAETLRKECGIALERLATGYASGGDPESGIAYAQRWLALDPLHEPAHRCLMRLYAQSGRRSEALLQYETSEQLLEKELGVAPDPETRSLSDAIREGRVGPLPVKSKAPERPRHNLPPQPTSFVGRETELSQIRELLADPACRLLGVVGPGGTGKTRLAIRAARDQVQHFAHGVFFVPLDAVDSPDHLASAITDALDVSSFGSTDLKVQLVDYLREKHLLLILDGFEHLLEGTTLVTAMLREADRVKVLITSRERLNLREEWLMPLEGMEVPEEKDGPTARADEYSALQLFLQCARRVRHDFSLESEAPGAVARICRLVDGMPLAIELAAPWVRVMQCEDIALRIQDSLGFLATSMRGVPSRHRSIRAVFDRSWEMLSAEGKEVLEKVSVFPRGFRWEAAHQVAGASLEVLSSLVDASWIGATHTGRYQIHQLVRQYANEKLDAKSTEEGREGSDPARDRHSRYYADLVKQYEPDLFGRGQRQAFRDILEEMDNVWAAWNWAVRQGDVSTLGRCVRTLEEVAELRGWRREVSQALGEAADMLRDRVQTSSDLVKDRAFAEIRTVLAEIVRSQARECLAMGLLDRANTLCEESLAQLSHVGCGPRQRAATARATGLLGLVAWNLGDHDKGAQLTREALSLSEEVRDTRGTAEALIFLAGASHHLGQYDRAERLLKEATRVTGAAGDLRYRAWCLGDLAEVLRDKGDYDGAREAAQEALQIRRELGDRPGIAHSHWTLAWIARGLGNQELAGKHFQDGLTLGQETGSQESVAVSLCGLGTVAFAQGQHTEAKRFYEDSLDKCMKGSGIEVHALAGLGRVACVQADVGRSRRYFQKALAVAMEAERAVEAMEVLIGLTHLLISESAPAQAVELLGFAVHHPATRHAARSEAQELLVDLKTELAPDAFDAAMARGRTRDLEDVASEVLAEEGSLRS
jgi:DNA-binding SARP family transcriptional activator/predicted ATPase